MEKAETELEQVKIEDEVTDVICEECGRNMVVKYGPHGKFLACPGFPDCKNTKPYLEKTGLDAEALSERINTAFAEVTMAVVLADARFKGIYSTGGDITAAIHRAAGTVGLRLLAEVVPLAGYGIAMGGRLEGRAFISKGGMVGDENAMVTCVSYLQEHIV